MRSDQVHQHWSGVYVFFISQPEGLSSADESEIKTWLVVRLSTKWKANFVCRRKNVQNSLREFAIDSPLGLLDELNALLS